MNDYKMTSSELRATWSLGIIFSLRMLGMFMVLPVLTTYGMTLDGANEVLIGLAIGIYGLAQAIFQIPFGFLSDRVGRKPIIVSGLLIFFIGSIIAAVFHSIWGIILGRALQGSGAISSAVIGLLSDLTREQNRTKAMAFIGVSFGVTFAIAMILGPMISYSFGLKTIFWMISLLAIIGILLTLWMVPNSKNHVPNREIGMVKSCFRKVLIEPQLMKFNFGIMCLHILLMSAFIAIPGQLLTAGFPFAEHWKIYLIIILISFISIIPLIIFVEIKQCIKLIFLLCIVLLLGAEVMLWSAHARFWWLMIGMQILFFSFSLMEALIPSLISKESPAGYKGTAMGVYSTSQFIGVAIGGFLGGWIDNLFNSQTIFLAGSLLTIVWLLVASSMNNPSYVSSICIKIPENLQFSSKTLKIHLEAKSGVNEVLIVPEERSIYLKIDNKLTNRLEIEKAINLVL